MTTEQFDFTLSQLSLNGSASAGENEDWDRSMNLSDPESRNSVTFPANVSSSGDGESTPGRGRGMDGQPKRTLSELLKLHAENGKDVSFSQEEASRIAEVLGQWINSGPSPYEGEDDFFTRSQDDSAIGSKRSPSSPSLDSSGRPRGQSESVYSASS